MNPFSHKPVSARVLDAAIAWQLCLEGSGHSAVEQAEFEKWHAADEEHARAWSQLGMLDQRFSGTSAPARSALLKSRDGAHRRMRKLGSGLASVALACGLALLLGNRFLPI
ncbi:FecR/PupR family sigma factor regulator, partial [Pseudomonas asplenii]|uniref:FecR/PupR family sigma factor regulator n=2 Tax=Pseudomonas TaxID=286 RepID=UPI0006CD895B